MNSFKLGRLHIENFKLFEKIEIDFSENDLNIFDGPNGYGKSSVFDALEIVFTGKISRFNDFGNIHSSSPKDILFSKDPNKSVKIILELISDSNIYLLAYLNPKDLKSAESKKFNKIIFKLFILENYNIDLKDNEIETLPKTDFQNIEKILNQTELAKFYSVKNYIQQFDPTSFLKRTEIERMEYLSKLFGTDEEEKQLAKFKDYKTENQKLQRDLEDYQNVQKENLNELRNNYLNIEYKTEYKQVFKNDKIQLYWDKQNIPIESKEKLGEIIQEINQFIKLINSKDVFLNIYTSEIDNKFINDTCENNKLLENTVIYYNFIDSFSSFEELNNDHKKKEKELNFLKNSKNQLTRESINGNSNLKSELDEIEKIIGKQFEDNKLISIIQKIEEKKNTQITSEDLLGSIQNLRKSLIDKFSGEHFHIDKKECPLCGYDWKSQEELAREFQKQEEKINTLLSSSMLELNQLQEELFVSFIIPITLKIDDYLNSIELDENFIKFFNQLNISPKEKNETILFIEELKKRNIDIGKYCNSDQSNITNLSERVENLIKFLQSNIKNNEKNKSQIEYDQLIKVFQNIMQSNIENFELLDLDGLNGKIDYVNYIYYSGINKSILEIEKLIEKSQKEIDTIKTFIKEIDDIIKIYEGEITKFWEEVLKQIELPFYIYSGKILQYHQNGLGIFINPEERSGKKTFIRFTPRNNTSNDALLSMSTGQLSALMISLMLALHRTYENNLNVLLIDDPVQTMDDINMASLIEILRNDFPDKQIILSTHEDDVSMYFRFKYKSFGLKQQRINMKDYTLSKN